MLFGRLRVPLSEYEHPLARSKERTKSGLHLVAVRDGSPRPPLTELDAGSCEDEFAGLDRLDREELDED
jgi:hypothetical protein